jgi:myosin heavy subunit
MFKAEQSEYVKEGVPWKEIKFKDKQGCIDLIEKPFSGIISLMDEEARVPQGSDEGLLL